MPLFSPALGATVPDSPHATVVCLPTLADVIAYERKDPRVWSLIRAGYPRFVRNELVTLAAEEYAQRLALTPDSECLPPGFPSPPWAMFPLARIDVAERLAAQAGCGPSMLALGFDGGVVLLVVEAGDAAIRLAKLVQHTGTLISSRQAEAWLADAPTAPDTGSPAVRAALAPYFHGVAPDDLLLCSSGMNAVDAALHAVDAVQAPAGRRVWIQLGWLYVDSIRLLEKNPGVERRFVHDVTDLAAVEFLLARGDVAGVLTEAPNNPQLQTADLLALRALCDRHGALLVVDPSSAGVAATDTLPFADLVACSLTKYAAAAVEGVHGGEAADEREARRGDFLPDDRVATGADMGMDADDLQVVLLHDGLSLIRPLVPDTERGVWPADVGLAVAAGPAAWVEAQAYLLAGKCLADPFELQEGASIDLDSFIKEGGKILGEFLGRKGEAVGRDAGEHGAADFPARAGV